MPDGNIFDFAANAWQRVDSMRHGRWYPTNTSLGSGKVLVTSGALNGCSNANNSTPEVWQPASGTWHRLGGAVRELPLYPWLFAAPNGKVFNAGPNVDTGYLDLAGTGTWTGTGNTTFGGGLLVPGSPLQNGQRIQGTAVMYQPGRILVMGGTGGYGAAGTNGNRAPGVTNTTELIELTPTGAQFRPGPPMQYPRHHVNSTLLPDGSVLVTGGTAHPYFPSDAYAVLPAELWSPPSAAYPDGRWTTLAAMQ